MELGKMNERKQEGYWISLGGGFGIMFGLLLGMPFDNSSLGLLIGISVGLIFGYVLEKKLNPHPIPLTKKQRKLKVFLAIIAFAIALLIAGFISLNVGKDSLTENQCKINSDCQTPTEYLIQSNCPFSSACINDVCRVICPLTYHDPSPEISESYPLVCTSDNDCDCSSRGVKTLDCKCLEGSCVSIEK